MIMTWQRRMCFSLDFRFSAQTTTRTRIAITSQCVIFGLSLSRLPLSNAKWFRADNRKAAATKKERKNNNGAEPSRKWMKMKEQWKIDSVQFLSFLDAFSPLRGIIIISQLGKQHTKWLIHQSFFLLSARSYRQANVTIASLVCAFTDASKIRMWWTTVTKLKWFTRRELGDGSIPFPWQSIKRATLRTVQILMKVFRWQFFFRIHIKVSFSVSRCVRGERWKK